MVPVVQPRADHFTGAVNRLHKIQRFPQLHPVPERSRPIFTHNSERILGVPEIQPVAPIKLQQRSELGGELIHGLLVQADGAGAFLIFNLCPAHGFLPGWWYVQRMYRSLAG